MATLALNVIVRAIGRDLNPVFGSLLGFLRKVGPLAIAATGVLVGLRVAMDALKVVDKSVQAFTNFEIGLKRAAVVMEGGVENIEQLEAAAKSLAITTIFTATEVAQGLFFLGQAGLDLEESLAAIQPTLNLAQIGALDLGTAADIATNVMNSMRLDVEDLSFVMDVLTVTFTQSNTTITQLGTAFAKIGPLAATLGIEFTEVAAAMGVLANAGIKGEEAGTAIRNIFLRLLNPSRDAEETMSMLGITAQDVANGMLNLNDILTVFGRALDSGAIGADSISEIFQARATPAILALIASLDDAEAGFGAFQTSLEDSRGEAETMVDFLDDSAFFSFQQFKAVIEDLLIAIGEKITPSIVAMTRAIKDNSGGMKEVIDAFSRLGPALVRLGPVLEEVLIKLIDTFIEMEKSGDIDLLAKSFIDLTQVIIELRPLLVLVPGTVRQIVFAIRLAIGIVTFFADGLRVIGFATIFVIDQFRIVAAAIQNASRNFQSLNAVIDEGMSSWRAFVFVIASVANGLNDISENAEKAKNAITVVGSALFQGASEFVTGVGAGANLIPQQQSGGQFRVKQSGLVNVHSPEILTVTNPSRGQTLPGAGGGDTFNIVINVNSGGEAAGNDVARALRDELNRMRRR
jgi:TP901 family phage tail tape measure protein